jgi:hypothetical protein
VLIDRQQERLELGIFEARPGKFEAMEESKLDFLFLKLLSHDLAAGENGQLTSDAGLSFQKQP